MTVGLVDRTNIQGMSRERRRQLILDVGDCFRTGVGPSTCDRAGECDYLKAQVNEGQLNLNNVQTYVPLVCLKYPGICEANK
jgi:hypothetical protein